MDAQLIGLLAVGATLSGVLLVGLRGIRQDMDKRFNASEAKSDARFDALEAKSDARFEALEAKFDAQFEAVDQRFDAAEQVAKARFDAVDQRFDAAEQVAKARFEAIDQQFGEINGRLSALESGQADMRERMARLEGILEGLAFRTQVMPVSATSEEA